MTIIELIKRDFENIFPTIFKNGRVELDVVEGLIDTPNSYIIEELIHLKGMVGVDEAERESLLDFIYLMDEAETSIDYDQFVYEKLQNYSNTYPESKTFVFLKTKYEIEHYSDGGLGKSKLSEYYIGIFEHYPELIELNDFFEHSGFLIPIYLLEEPSKELVQVFQSAVARFPDKALLKFSVARLFHMIKDYGNSLLWHLHFVRQVNAERIYVESNDIYEYPGDYTMEDYHISVSSVASVCFYELKDYENATVYSEACLSEFKRNGEDVYSFQVLFLDPILILLRLCIHYKEHNEFKHYYRLLRSRMEDVDFYELEIDDVKEFVNLL